MVCFCRVIIGAVEGQDVAYKTIIAYSWKFIWDDFGRILWVTSIWHLYNVRGVVYLIK